MKEELIKIINELKEVIVEAKLNVSDDILFQESSTFLRGSLMQQNKNYNQYQKKESKDEPMTEKQDKFIKKNYSELKKRGFDVDNIQNRKQATEIIKEFLK